MGDSGPAVADLQIRLAEVLLYRGPFDGVYDNRTRQAVAAFQHWRGITADPSGVYGPATRAALEATTTAPAEDGPRRNGWG
jgi:peptidoglycan hydrolase-like protein with peptidoglycan-binding domain